MLEATHNFKCVGYAEESLDRSGQRGGVCNQEEEDVTQDAVATLHTGKEGRVQKSESRSKTGGAKGKE